MCVIFPPPALFYAGFLSAHLFCSSFDLEFASLRLCRHIYYLIILLSYIIILSYYIILSALQFIVCLFIFWLVRSLADPTYTFSSIIVCGPLQISLLFIYYLVHPVLHLCAFRFLFSASQCALSFRIRVHFLTTILDVKCIFPAVHNQLFLDIKKNRRI